MLLFVRLQFVNRQSFFVCARAFASTRYQNAHFEQQIQDFWSEAARAHTKKIGLYSARLLISALLACLA